jgi:hypothetical protein
MEMTIKMGGSWVQGERAGPPEGSVENMQGKVMRGRNAIGGLFRGLAEDSRELLVYSTTQLSR